MNKAPMIFSKRITSSLVAVVAGVLVLGSCKELIGGGTSFLAHINFDESLGVHQLKFRGFDGTTQIFGPTRRPDTPTRAMYGSQSIRIEFPDALAGKTITVVVDGIREEVVVAHGSSSGLIRKGKQSDLAVQLQTVDAGTMDGGCGNCAGCCAYGTCFAPSRASCGMDSGTCTACDGRADRCLNGSCACGNGGTCANGLECDGGSCQCTPRSCPGCCALRDGGPTCYGGSDPGSCGTAGKPCAACSTQCDAGVCVGQCDCSTGCCSGTTCYSGSEWDRCGWGGSACSVCLSPQSHCGPSLNCQCGLGPPCGPGEYCIDDRCTCSPSSCPNGCCTSAGTCALGISQDACGARGEPCSACDPGEVCRYQQCMVDSP